jgi:hypothetical protein
LSLAKFIISSFKFGLTNHLEKLNLRRPTSLPSFIL